jgi:hypothetical protein
MMAHQHRASQSESGYSEPVLSYAEWINNVVFDRGLRGFKRMRTNPLF